MQVTFTLTAQATYELVLPAINDAIKVTAWLESKGASCDRYFRSNGTVKFVFIAIPDTLVAQIASKYSLVDLTPVSPAAPDTIPDSDRLEDVRAYYKDQFDSCRNVQEIVARYKQFTSEDLTPEEEAILDSEFEFYLGCCGYCRDKNGNVVESCPEEEEVSDRPEEDVFEKVNIPLSYFHIPYFFADIYTDKEIKARYRQLSKIHHPDAGGNPEMFHALQSQYLQAIEP